MIKNLMTKKLVYIQHFTIIYILIVYYIMTTSLLKDLREKIFGKLEWSERIIFKH